jgi:serine/threonine protein kinase
VLSDFGAAIQLSQNPSQSKTRMFSVTGTYSYMAPFVHRKLTSHLLNVFREVLRANITIPAGEGYSKAVDSWSVGVMTSYILTASNPFTDRHTDDTESTVLRENGELGLSKHFHEFIAPKIGLRPTNFIERLCELDETARLSIEGALEHPWFTNGATVHDLNHLYEKATIGWSPRVQSSEIHEIIPQVSPRPKQSHPILPSASSKQALEFTNRHSEALIIPDSQPSEVDKRHQSLEQDIQDLINQDLIEMGTQWNPYEPSVPRPGNKHCAFDPGDNDEGSDPIESDFSFPYMRKRRGLPVSNARSKLNRIAKKRALNRNYEYRPVLEHAFRRGKVSRYEAQWPVRRVGDGFR